MVPNINSIAFATPSALGWPSAESVSSADGFAEVFAALDREGRPEAGAQPQSSATGGRTPEEIAEPETVESPEVNNADALTVPDEANPEPPDMEEAGLHHVTADADMSWRQPQVRRVAAQALDGDDAPSQPGAVSAIQPHVPLADMPDQAIAPGTEYSGRAAVERTRTTAAPEVLRKKAFRKEPEASAPEGIGRIIPGRDVGKAADRAIRALPELHSATLPVLERHDRPRLNAPLVPGTPDLVNLRVPIASTGQTEVQEALQRFRAGTGPAMPGEVAERVLADANFGPAGDQSKPAAPQRGTPTSGTRSADTAAWRDPKVIDMGTRAAKVSAEPSELTTSARSADISDRTQVAFLRHADPLVSAPATFSTIGLDTPHTGPLSREPSPTSSEDAGPATDAPALPDPTLPSKQKSTQIPPEGIARTALSMSRFLRSVQRSEPSADTPVGKAAKRLPPDASRTETFTLSPLQPAAATINAESSHAAEPFDRDNFVLLVGTASDSRNAAQASHTPVAPHALRSDQAATVLRQMFEVTGKLQDGPVELRLNPEELGRVRMHMVSVDQGMVMHITSERPETLDLLRRHIDQLHRELSDLGYSRVDFTFGRHGGDSGPGNAPRDARQPDPAAGDTATEIETLRQTPLTAARDGLDLRL